jgi:hypothetical protein
MPFSSGSNDMNPTLSSENETTSHTLLWQSTLIWIIIFIGTTIPFWMTNMPPLLDLPGHMARYHIAQEWASSPDLQRYYSYKWMLSGNLGGDLIVYGLKDVLSVEQASWLVCLLTVLLTTLAIPVLSKTFHGSVQLSSLCTLPLVYHNFYFWGFVNFNLGVAFTLLSLALWHKMRVTPYKRTLLFIPIAFLIWLTHSLSWALLLLFVGMLELERIWREKKLTSVQAWLGIVARIVPLMIPLIFLIIWRSKDGFSLAYYHEGFIAEKLSAMVLFLRGYVASADYIGTVVLLMIVIVSWRTRHMRVISTLTWCGLSLLVVFLITPSYVLGSNYTDLRLVHIFILLFLLSIKTPSLLPTKQLSIIGVVFLSYFFIRTATITWHWRSIAHDTKQHVLAFNKIPFGARILAFQIKNCNDTPWKISYHYNHMMDLVIIKRNAFVNAQWAVLSSLPSRPIYNQDTEFGSDPSEYVWEDSCVPKTGRLLKNVLPTFPRDRFDFVWLIRSNFRITPIPKDLTLVYKDFETELYAVKH